MCHHIPGWHACLYIAEVQALARAACGEEASARGQGLSAHLLPEPVRNHHLLAPLMQKAAPVRLETCCPVTAAFCMFGLVVQWSSSPPPLSVKSIQRARPFRSCFRRPDALKRHPTSSLCFISYLTYYAVEVASPDLQRKMKPCSQLQFADSHFKVDSLV